MVPYQSACVSNAAASNWLSLRLQLLAAVLLSAVAALAAMVAAAIAADTAAAAAGVGGNIGSSSLSVPVAPNTFSHRDLSGSSSSGSSGGLDGSNASSWVGGTFRIDLLGLALAYCLPIVNLLNGLLTSSAETEQDMVAVERIAALLETLGQEGEQQQQQQRGSRRRLPAGSNGSNALLEPLLQQPHQQQEGGRASTGRGSRALSAAAAAGAVEQQQQQQLALELVDVVMRYRPGLPPALRGVCLRVPVGHKLGVCGRTGLLGWGVGGTPPWLGGGGWRGGRARVQHWGGRAGEECVLPVGHKLGVCGRTGVCGMGG